MVLNAFFGTRSARDGYVLDAMRRSRAYIAFTPDGHVLEANELFLDLMEYDLDEIVGRHHRMFVDPDDADLPEYAFFWELLSQGEFAAGTFRRRTKSGRAVTLQASYDPVTDADGKVTRVVKFASDVSAAAEAADLDMRRLLALYRYQAVIEFDTTGVVLRANANFLNLMGYEEEEVVGAHHGIFVGPTTAASPDYATFWKDLAAGAINNGQFTRYRKDGSPVRIQASYSPIKDRQGNVERIVKFATDVTTRVESVEVLGEGLARFADGDLSRSIESPLHPDFEPLRAAYNGMVARVADLVRQINAAAVDIAASVAKVTQDGGELARLAEAQSGTLGETAATVEEIAETIRGTATNAEAAASLAREAEARATRAREVMDSAIASMRKIEAASGRIGEITSVIESISFQTNLLAINAAIEASRAGDAGRGFTVVAAEVRALAHRASEAAAGISRIVAESGACVRDGDAQIQASGAALNDILDSVAGLASRIGEISVACRAQTSGVDQIAGGTSHLEGITERNVALAEANSATADALEANAACLTALVEYFRLRGDDRSLDAAA